jgi:cytochrome c oxidase subunit 2
MPAALPRRRPAVSRARHSGRRPGGRARRALLAATAAAGASLLLAPGALGNFLTLKSGGSPNADNIASLYNIILVLAIIVAVIVEGALIYSVFRFRARRSPVAAQIHGNTRLEIGWTVGAALILVIIAVVTFVKLGGILHPPNSDANGVLSASLGQPQPPNGNKLTICVQSRQFVFRYTYGNNCLNNAFSGKLPYSYTDMIAPANTTVVLAIQASDVIHNWWVPSLGGKVDAVPGYTTYTWFKSSHVGSVYMGHCAQLCGRGHAAMLARVKIVSPAAYRQFLQNQANMISAANSQVTQLRQSLTASGNL